LDEGPSGSGVLLMDGNPMGLSISPSALLPASWMVTTSLSAVGHTSSCVELLVVLLLLLMLLCVAVSVTGLYEKQLEREAFRFAYCFCLWVSRSLPLFSSVEEDEL
jgi:hypothetical protein